MTLERAARGGRIGRRALTLGAATGLALAVAVPGGWAQEAIRMGGMVSVTGGGAAIGTTARMGWELAIKEINAAGGIMGRPVEFVLADTQTDPTHAVSEARRLIENEGVQAMVGPVTSQEVIPVTAVTTEKGIAQVTTAASTTITPEVAPYHFSNSPTGLNQMIANIDYAIDVMGAQKIALITDNGGMSKAAASEIVEYMTGRGHAPVIVQEFAFRAEDMTPQLFSMREAGADAVLIIGSLVDDVRTFLRNRDEIGWGVPVLGSLTLTNYAVGVARDLGPEVFEGVLSVQFRGMTYCPGEPEGTSMFAQFAARARAEYPDIDRVGGPSAISPYYIEPLILKAAIEGAGSLEGAAVAAWIVANAGSIENMLGTFAASDTSHFLPSSDAMAVVKNAYAPRADGLVERVVCD
ncbi:MAG: ABC transporter substrate-binding protein [Rhodobacteraceae bacterium]|jgi:ABC-type branched-subunit amino acid transport system substrate-binding protein|nr:ABC transporter substrate-binding protein [Paracoccaceae bacterium]